jgi:hypothetical protein
MLIICLLAVRNPGFDSGLAIYSYLVARCGMLVIILWLTCAYYMDPQVVCMHFNF